MKYRLTQLLIVSVLSMLLHTNDTLATEILIENINLISPERTISLPNANVRIQDNRIIEVSTEQIKASLDAVIIDGKNRFLIPGLMDSHVHVSSMPGASLEEGGQKYVAELISQFHAQQPKSYLYFGVTQILDPSQSTSAIKTFNQSPLKPDFFHCGAVPILNGYPALYLGDEKAMETFDYLMIEDNQHTANKSQSADGPTSKLDKRTRNQTPEDIVKKIADAGAICVKIFLEDGFGSRSDWPMIAQATVERLKTAAKARGLILMAHANAIDMQKIAVEMEVDVIAHGMWNWNEYDGSLTVPEPIQKLADKIIENNIVYQPTFGVMDGLKGVVTPSILENPLYTEVVPSSILAWYKTNAGQWFQREMLTDYGNLPLDRIHQRQNINIRQGEMVLGYLHRKNHPLVVASDTPAAPTFAQQPGLSTYQEILHMHKAGISLKNILKAATINNAKAFGLDSQYGTITPGKIANLLVLSKNPLENVEAYNSIQKIILNGKVIERNSLRAN